jgi:hypothetical protein
MASAMKIARMLSVALIALASSLLAGCLPTWVGNPDTAVVKPEYVGVWFRVDGSDTEVWAVHKMNERTYLIQSYIVDADDAGKPTVSDQAVWRAWLADVGGQEFVSMEAYAVGQLLDTEPLANRYVVARVDAKPDELTIRGVDPDFIKGKSIETPQQLEALIKQDVNANGLYVEAQSFQRLTEQNRGQIERALEAIK